MIGARKCSRKLFENGEPLQHGVGHALATPARERKRVHEHGADLLVQFIAHEPPCAMQPRLHCIRLNTEEVRGVLGAHALDHPRHEYNPKYLGEMSVALSTSCRIFRCAIVRCGSSDVTV